LTTLKHKIKIGDAKNNTIAKHAINISIIIIPYGNIITENIHLKNYWKEIKI
jgi:hypothetical protein